MSRPSARRPSRPSVDLPYRFTPRGYQRPVLQTLERGCKRAVTIWHRKAGKDLLALIWTITRMVQRPGLYLHLFPDGVQARRVIWDGMTVEGVPFRDFFPPEIVLETNETEMSIKTIAKDGAMSIYQLVGTDKPERLRGPNPIGVIFSEYSYQNPEAWETIAPVLAANGGWAWFNCTPCGRNHALDLHRRACADPEWFTEVLTIEQTKKDAPGEDGGPVVTPEILEAERHRGVDEDFIQQEYFCSFEGTRSGSYYGEALRRARTQGRITRVPWDPTVPVEVWTDLGLGTHRCEWYVQHVGPRVHVIRFSQGSGSESIVELAKLLKEFPYTYSTHVWPHDAAAKDIGTGRTRKEMAEALGIGPIEVVPKGSVYDGITAVKALLERCYFDEEACRQGLDCLAGYHRLWDPKGQTWREEPDGDWSSHAADAFRTGAMGSRGGLPAAREIKVESNFSFDLGGNVVFIPGR
jgi:phage terminase large subunit